MEKTGWQREVGEQVTAHYCGQIVTGTITETGEERWKTLSKTSKISCST